MTPMTSDTDVLGLGLDVLVYHPKNLRFLDGARYQGSTFEGDADITFGTCTGSYKMQGLTPSPIGFIGPCEDDTLCDPFGNPAERNLRLGPQSRLRDRLREGGLGDHFPHRQIPRRESASSPSRSLD